VSVNDGVRVPGVRVLAYARGLILDRVTLALSVVFLLSGAFYVWISASALPLALNGGGSDAYNQLANAFLHLHLSVGRAPAGLLRLPEPYNPEQNSPFQDITGILKLGIHDFALYQGKLFITWGPAPVIVLLIPLHLLGFEPTGSVTVSVFAVVGLGFALAILRAILRQLGEVPLWMCVLAGFTLALVSAVPFILSDPAVYEEEIAAGYCFAMAGIWLAVTVLIARRASLLRLTLMSLCFGLAVGSRPTLVFAAALLVPVYISLRAVRPRRGLLLALAVPVGLCGVLLLLYNQVRFGSPLENGVKYQLAGLDQNTIRFGDPAYIVPGLWFYFVSPPRVGILFPFISVFGRPLAYPGSLPGLYATQEAESNGLLPMAPILLFAAALPWLWRRRSAALGQLSLPLLVLASGGMACALFVSYEFFVTTERYEVDFATLMLLAALASWLALSTGASGWLRRLARIVGAVLAVWSCVVGLAISFSGYYSLLATTHPGTWRALEDITSPVSRAIAVFKGHPVLAEVSAPGLPLLSTSRPARMIVVSPDTRRAVLVVSLTSVIRVSDGIARASYSAAALVRNGGHSSAVYRTSPGGGTVRIPLNLRPGLNRLVLVPLAAGATNSTPGIPAAQQLLLVGHISLASG
jgi:hypothetical protein